MLDPDAVRVILHLTAEEARLLAEASATCANLLRNQAKGHSLCGHPDYAALLRARADQYDALAARFPLDLQAAPAENG